MKKTLTYAMSMILAGALTVPMFAQPTPAPAAAAKTTAPKAAKAPATPAPSDQEINDAKAKGLVWVNLSTKVYHSEGQFYGKTKHGKFMAKDEAEKAGFKAAKEPAPKKVKAAAAKTDKK